MIVDACSNALKEVGCFDGNIFNSGKYRLALYLFQPNSAQIQSFYRHALYGTLQIIESDLDHLSPDERNKVFGPMAPEIRSTVETAVRLKTHLIDASLEAERHDASFVEAMNAYCDKFASETEAEFTALRRISDFRVDQMPQYMGRNRRNVEDLIVRYFKDQASERRICINDAASLLEEVLDQPEGASDAMSWLLYSWVLAQRDGFKIQTMTALSNAALNSESTTSQLYIEVRRAFAYGHYLSQAGEQAFQVLSKVSAMETSIETLMELTRHAYSTNRIREANDALVHIARIQPLALLAFFSDEQLQARIQLIKFFAGNTIADSTANAKESLIRAEALLNNIEGLSRSEVAPFEFKEDFRSELRNTRNLLSNKTFLGVRYAEDRANAIGDRVIQSALMSIERERIHAIGIVDSSTQKLEMLRRWKNETYDKLESEIRKAKADDRKLLGLSATSHDTSNSALVRLVTISCALYAVYFIVCFFSPALSARIGPASPHGGKFLLALGAPILLGVLATMSSNIKGSALTKAINEIESKYNAALAERKEECDRHYESQAPDAILKLESMRQKVDRLDDASTAVERIRLKYREAA